MRKEAQTVVLLDKRLVDDVVVVDVQIDGVIVHVEVDDVYHRREEVIVTRWARAPILSKVYQHVDVITKKVETRLTKGYRKRPLSYTVPLERRWETASNLSRTSMRLL